jgi:hypothetical protein
MRVVIRFGRKSAKVEPARGFALNGAGTLAAEPSASVAVAEPAIIAEPEDLPPVAMPEPEPLAAVAQADAMVLPELAPPMPLPGPEPVAPAAMIAPEPEPAPMPAPPLMPPAPRQETKPDKVRCPRCTSSDTWRFGRVKGIRLAMASLARGQWITCRGCGNRFITRHYGPMEEDEDDD